MTEHRTDAKITGKYNTMEPKSSKEIKVVIHIPETVHEKTQRQKINRIYDILNP